MTELTERKLGWGFGIAGAILLFAGALISFVMAAADFVVGHTLTGATDATAAVLLIVVGGLALFFAHLGYRSWSDRPAVSGVLLIVIAVVGWLVLGLGANVAALAGALFVFLSGVLYLVGPVIRAVEHPATA